MPVYLTFFKKLSVKIAKIYSLNISNKKLEGDLNLEGFVNLEILNCGENMLTSLELSNCKQLREIDCSFNNIINIFFYIIIFAPK